MKQKDIALIIIIVFFGGILSYFISKTIFGSPAARQQQVEVVQPISADFPPPDERYFNDKAFNPTRLITIGDNANPDPFSDNKQ